MRTAKGFLRTPTPPLSLAATYATYATHATVILYSFYKNVVLTAVQFFFMFYSAYGGTSLVEEWVYTHTL
jgi:hypothetical protein